MILTRKTAEDKNEDDPDDNQEEAALGEITWDWGCTPVPTVDLLYPDESPEEQCLMVLGTPPVKTRDYSTQSYQ